jgi:Holliday junction resolvase
VTAYRRGVYREELVKTRLEDEGYLVMRAPGSRGQPDLVAIKPYQVLAIQVKSGDAEKGGAYGDKWWNELWAVAQQAGAIPIVADWPKKGCLRMRRITGMHRPHGKHWPYEEFATDEVVQ